MLDIFVCTLRCGLDDSLQDDVLPVLKFAVRNSKFSVWRAGNHAMFASTAVHILRITTIRAQIRSNAAVRAHSVPHCLGLHVDAVTSDSPLATCLHFLQMLPLMLALFKRVPIVWTRPLPLHQPLLSSSRSHHFAIPSSTMMIPSASSSSMCSMPMAPTMWRKNLRSHGPPMMLTWAFRRSFARKAANQVLLMCFSAVVLSMVPSTHFITPYCLTCT